MSADPSVALAQAVVRELVGAGVREAVVCAGARNAALVAVLGKTPALRLWSFPEERSAAFFALGRVMREGRPVAVVTTSGTAAAELLPAVIEAFYQGQPLILVTADRPRAYRGTGAPQAIEQVGLFSRYVYVCEDIDDSAQMFGVRLTLNQWDGNAPFHLNVCLEEPSAAALAAIDGMGSNEWDTEFPATGQQGRREIKAFRASHACEAVQHFLDDTDGAGPLVAVVASLPQEEQGGVLALLKKLGCPVIAEATSGLRESPGLAAQLVRGGESALSAVPVGRVLRIGGVPSSRWWRDLESKPDVSVLSLSATDFPGLARASEVCGFPDWPMLEPDEALYPIPNNTTNTPRQEQEQGGFLAAYPRSEPALVYALSKIIPRGALVFLGNSLPIREWNSFATTEDRGLRCFANRGANGIDGCVSTFLGLSADESESWCVIGDLTALYDLAALWITPALPAARRRLVVINNGGGRIFSRVAALRGLGEAERRLMENPHALKFQPWAEMFGWEYRCVTTPEELALLPGDAPNLLIEMIPDPEQTEAFWAASSETVSPSAIQTPHSR